MYLQRHFLVKCTFLPSSNLLFQVTFQSSFEIQVFCILIWLSRFALLTLDLSSKTAYKKICSIKHFYNKSCFQKYCNIHCYCNIHFTVKQTAAIDYQNKVKLWSILILKAVQSTKKQKRLTSQSSLQTFKRYISDMNFFCWIAKLCHFFCHYHISLICLIHLSMPNIYFYTIRSITMFLRVINKANCKVLIYYWLTPICETLVAINCSLSERRIIFVPQLLSSPVFRLFYN